MATEENSRPLRASLSQKPIVKVAVGLVGCILILWASDYLGGLIFGVSSLNRYRVGQLIEKGNELKKQGAIKAALSCFDRAIAIDPTNAEAYFGRGAIHYSQKDFAQAKLDLLQSAQHARTLTVAAESQLYLGILAAEAGDKDDSLKHFTIAIEMNPMLARAYIGRANVLASQQQYNEALPDFNRAIEIEPGGADWYIDRARVHEQLGDMELAILDAERAVALEPKSVRAQAVMALVHIERKQWQEAISCLTFAILSAPLEANFYELRAHAYRELGAHASAEQDIQQAESLRTNKASH